MTFSIVASDPDRGDLGIAVASKFIAVGSIVPWARPRVGAVATQAWANVRHAPHILFLMEQGISPKRALEMVLAGDPRREHRQLGVVNARGEAAAFTGRECLEYAGHIVGDGYAVQGNILAGPQVLEKMSSAYENTRGELVDKLLAALEAGDKAGGDKRGRQGAAILVVRPCGGYGGCEEGVDKYVDLRVDDHPDPVRELRRLFRIWELTILEREDPSSLIPLEEVVEDVQRALSKLGFYRATPSGKLDEATIDALNRWIAVNNFENKMRSDRMIWKSIYDYLLEQAGLR